MLNKLLGAEIALSAYTGSCGKNAGDKGLHELSAVFYRQKILFVKICNAIATLILKHATPAACLVNEFVSGAQHIECGFQISSQTNPLQKLSGAHRKIIGMLHNNIFSVNNHFPRFLIDNHLAMVAEFESVICKYN